MQHEASESPLHLRTTTIRLYFTGSFIAPKFAFHTAMTIALGGAQVDRMLSAMSEDNDFSVFISPEQKRALILSIFSAYYHPQVEKEIIFDTNRLWCGKLPLILELFPQAKVICCVRNIAWIMDSIERLIRRNAFDVSRLFSNPAERATVYI